MIYIVMDYDATYDGLIEYAGIRFDEACKHVKGSGSIDVWKNGKWIGTMNTKGEWIWKSIIDV